MEEDIHKKGMLYMQQNRFGKKWKKVWAIIYRESSRSVSRMEFFDCKDSSAASMEKSERMLRKQENKKVIKLRDCIQVSPRDVEGCPKDCRAFLVETAEKLFLFSSESSELDSWTQALCEIAFPMSWTERGASNRSSVLRSRGVPTEVGMEDNSLYSVQNSVMKDFKVTIKKTEGSERCRLRGTYLLRTDLDSLLLKDIKSGEVLFSWPYRFLRRFGRDKMTFSFEAGRRCDSGEGNFEFETKQGNTLFQEVEKAIDLQKNNMAPQRQVSSGVDPALDNGSAYSTVGDIQPRNGPSPSQGARFWLEPPTDKTLTGVKSLTLDTRPPPQKNQVKNISSCPLMNSEDQTYSQISLPLEKKQKEQPEETPPQKNTHENLSKDTEYSMPFDSIAKNLMATVFLASQQLRMEADGADNEVSVDAEEPSDPLYDSIDESAIRSRMRNRAAQRTSAYTKPDHIYDEPEGCAAVTVAAMSKMSVYDDPEEFKEQAWKLQGSADPSGHEYPYNKHTDDYAVPKAPRKVSPVPTETHVNPENYEDTTYDNVMIKMAEKGNM